MSAVSPGGPPYAYRYPTVMATRKHGPAGYARYKRFKDWLRDEFGFRCVYCLEREAWSAGGKRRFSVEHKIPRSKSPKKELRYENLLYACLDCNSWRQDRELPVDPELEPLGNHVQVGDDGTVGGLSPRGSKLIELLDLDDPDRVGWRKRMLDTVEAAESVPNLLLELLGYPRDLPNLGRKRPPANTRPKGVEQACYVLRRRGELPEFY